MEKEKNFYNPNKRYAWEPTSEFMLRGDEFGMILNCLRNILNTPEASKILLANRANDIIEKTIAKAVEEGTVREMEEGET